VELSRSDDFNLSTGRKKSGTRSNREPESRRSAAGRGASAASFILRPYIRRPLFISFSLSSVALAGWPLRKPIALLSPLQPPLVFIPIFASSSLLSLRTRVRDGKSLAPGLLRGSTELQDARVRG